MKKKSLLAILLAGVMVLSTACGGGTSNKKNNSEGEGIVYNEKEQVSELSKKDYGGKTFKFLYWYEPSEYVYRKVATFNKVFNANVEIVVKTGLKDTLAKAVAGGEVYDIIAMHGNYYPELIHADLLEPLDEHIAEVDMYNSEKPENGGLSQAVLDSFSLDGSVYAAGGSSAVYNYIMCYNKLLFEKAGLEDPYELYKKGEWTWDKFYDMGTSVTDVASQIAFLGAPGLYEWLTWNCVETVTYDSSTGTFKENLASSEVVEAVKMYQSLLIGDTPISVTGVTGDPFNAGKQYMSMVVTDAYSSLADQVATSTAFGKDAANMGVVPVPTAPLNKTGKEPGHAPQGYAASKGCTDTSVAVCYALFESRLGDTDTGEANQLPSEVRTDLETKFATNGFLTYCGLADSEGKNITDVLNKTIRVALLKGGDAAAILNENRSVFNRLINDSMGGN